MNILLILADDIGPADVGTYRGKYYVPLLGKIAATGARFWNAWATPLCMPTRAGLLTGFYGPRTGHVGHTNDLEEARRRDAQLVSRGTIAHALRDLGYRTAVAGKWQHVPTPEALGFDRSFTWNRWNEDGAVYTRYWGPTLWRDGVKEEHPPSVYGPSLIADWTIDLLRSSEPTFVWHSEFLAHAEGGIYPATPDSSAGGIKANITYWTKIVDRMVRELPDTMIIITSDNGSEGDTKREATAAGAACILIVVGPGVTPSERHQLVDVTDHYATLLELASAGAGFCDRDGVSYAQALWNPSAPGRDWIYSWIDDKDMVRTLTRAREGDETVRDLEADFFGEIIRGIR